MDFALRNFEKQDFEDLWRIDQECFPPGISYSRDELSSYMQARGGFTIVAERSMGDLRSMGDSERILGFVMAEASRGTGHIITIDMVPASRRFGIGSALLAAAEQRLRAAKCSRIVMEAAVDNASALAFYKRHGYAAIKTIPQYYSNGVDALVLEKKFA
ncbi:MAG: GNAT family N-acetyltransferase [Terriglobales bacterium]